MEISNYEEWKFRRCLETLDRYGCKNDWDQHIIDKCQKCSYNIDTDLWEMIIRKNAYRF